MKPHPQPWFPYLPRSSPALFLGFQILKRRHLLMRKYKQHGPTGETISSSWSVWTRSVVVSCWLPQRLAKSRSLATSLNDTFPQSKLCVATRSRSRIIVSGNVEDNALTWEDCYLCRSQRFWKLGLVLGHTQDASYRTTLPVFQSIVAKETKYFQSKEVCGRLFLFYQEQTYRNLIVLWFANLDSALK